MSSLRSLSLNTARKKTPAVLAVLICMLTACKKDAGSTATVSTPAGTAALRDTMAAVARLDYLWNSNIPSTFNPAAYSSTDTLNAELQAIKSYSPLNSTTGNRYDHFSFMLTEADYKTEFPIGAAALGASATYGMKYSFDRSGNLRVSYAAHAAAIYQKGIRRGWKITQINSVKVATDDKTITALNNALNASSATFTFQNPSTGASVTAALTKQNLTDDEVIITKVFNQPLKTVGYIAYNTFLTPLDNNGNITHAGLDTAFTKLKAAGVTDLIIDLRYNGGGYTEVAEQMDDALIPAANNTQVLYTESYNTSLNSAYKAGNKSLDHDQTIYVNKTKSGNPALLNINSVVFIVSNNTASAAELVINNLKPYFTNLKLIGLGYGLSATYANTAGKPFGYAGSFAIPKKNPVYEAFILNFETKNASGVGDYVNGLVPDVQVIDGVEYDFGDSSEDGLSKALSYEETNSLSYARANTRLAVGSKASATGYSSLMLNKSIHQIGFQAMIKGAALSATVRQQLNYQKGGSTGIKR